MAIKTDGIKEFKTLKSSHPDWHDSIEAVFDEVVAVRRDLHKYPELAFEETRTAGIVAGLLKEWGYEVREAVG